MTPNQEVLKDWVRFMTTVIGRDQAYRLGEEWEDDPDDPALASNVDYFPGAIQLDQRMNYIMDNIVAPSIDGKLSMENSLVNAAMSHFYGAIGVHETLTGKPPTEAHIDFRRLLTDEKYKTHVREVSVEAKRQKKSVWGKTELHTSIQTAARKHAEHGDWSNVMEWMAHIFLEGGIVEAMMDPNTNAEKVFKSLTAHRGIGNYYGYHCMTSTSTDPRTKYHDDEKFCVPGPGACKTIDMMFDPVPKDKGSAVIWVAEHQFELLGPYGYGPELWRLSHHDYLGDRKRLTVYNTEVALCQYSVYCRLRDNPHLISKRTIAGGAKTQKPSSMAGFLE